MDGAFAGTDAGAAIGVKVKFSYPATAPPATLLTKWKPDASLVAATLAIPLRPNTTSTVAFVL